MLSVSMISTGVVEFTQQFAAAVGLMEPCPAAVVVQAPASSCVQSCWILGV